MNRFRMLPNYQYYNDNNGILETKYKKNMRDYQVYGNSIQNGEPSIDNPVEIYSVGEKSMNLWGKETINISAPQDVDVSWDSDGWIRFDVGDYSEDVECSTELNLLAGTYSICCSHSLNFYIDDTNLGNAVFKTITSTEDFILKLSTYASEVSFSFSVMVVEGEYTEDTMPKFEPHYTGYKIPIEVSGKNLLESVKVSSVSRVSYEKYGNGYKLTSNINTGGYGNFARIPLLPITELKWGQTYTLFFNINQSNTAMRSRLGAAYSTSSSTKFLASKTITENTNSYISLTFALPNEQPDDWVSGYLIFFINVQTAALDTFESICITDIMLVEGDEPSYYEPYIPTKTYDIYIDEPLRKIGKYADYIDFRSGKIVRVINKKVFGGSESINIPGSVIEGYTPFRHFISGGTYPFLCDKFPYYEINYDNAIGKGECVAKYGGIGNSQVFFIISNDRIPLNDIMAFKNWLEELYLNGNPVTLYYRLSQPIEEPIELPQLLLNKGTNIIKIKTAIEPSLVDWQYYK